MDCKFCGGYKIKSIKKVRSPYVKYEYTLYQCNNCKSKFFYFEEHDIDIKDIYEKLAVKHIEPSRIFKIRKSFYWCRQVHRIEKILNRKILSVLDVGCRTGDFLFHFPNNIAREGVELSENSAEIARKRGLRIYQDFVENINFDKRYDVVTCYAILEHLKNPLSFLDKLQNMVAPCGVLVILIPTYECTKRWIIDTFTSVRWHMYSPPEYLNFFSRRFLDNCLAKKNFKLADRYWTSGGMFNPFRDIHLAKPAFGKAMTLLDEYSLINKLPIFDHMYSYYKLVKE